MQLVPHAPPALVSDRYVALAVWPAVLLFVALAWRLNPIPRTALLLVMALLWGFQTIERPRDWQNFEVLLDSDLRERPGYYLPAMYKIVGVELPQGLYRDARETANSITDPDARDIMSGLVKAHYAVNVAAMSSGKTQEAIAILSELGLEHKQPPVQAQWNPSKHLLWEKRRHLIVFEWKSLSNEFPNDVFVHYNAGLWMLEFHDYKDAVVHLHTATESQSLPVSVRGTAYAGLGAALMFSGYIAEAEATLRTALGQPNPDPRAYCMLAEVYRQTNRLEEAARTEVDCRNHVPKEETAQ
jgi:tetratricopeptide (TPR) repeat protein